MSHINTDYCRDSISEGGFKQKKESACDVKDDNYFENHKIMIIIVKCTGLAPHLRKKGSLVTKIRY